MSLFLISVVFFQFVGVSGQGTPYNFNEDEIKLILYEHNKYRASEPAANMQELVWNQNLVDVAREWATKCIGDHRPDRTFKAGFAAVGENLWWTSSSVLWKNLRRVIWDFYREKYIYDFNTGYCPPGQLCGHYTQLADGTFGTRLLICEPNNQSIWSFKICKRLVCKITINPKLNTTYAQLVWASSCSIGCAAAFCPYFYNGRGIRSGVMVACNYGPAGNYMGQKPYVYGRNCQMCPDACRNGLCRSECTGYAIPQSYRIANVDNGTTITKLQSQSASRASHPTTKASTTAVITTTARPLTASVAEKRHPDLNASRKNRDCVNRHPDCMAFKKLLFCFVQRPYMLRYCRLACDISCHSL